MIRRIWQLDTRALATAAQPALAVMLASALGLYLEMVMVRWHSSCVHTFGVFQNVSMLSCFLGLGIGYARAGFGRRRLGLVLPLLAVQCLALAIVSRTRLGRASLNPVAEQYMMWQEQWRWWVEGLGGNVLVALVFVVNAVMFIPLGQLAGELMSRLPRLQAYAINLLGSLAGIALFLLLSAAWTGPIIWMSVAVLGFIPFLAGETFRASELVSTQLPSPRLRGEGPGLRGLDAQGIAVTFASLAAMMLALGLVDRVGLEHFYSPYQTITCRLGPDAKYPSVARLLVNQASYQRILDLSPAARQRHPELERVAAYYDLPYQLQPDARRVLVVGAGSGNDVAAALRAATQHVTAVEIDPTILLLGRRLHPERPYDDPRVEVVTDDARTFLRRGRAGMSVPPRRTGTFVLRSDQFDLIVYGLLDSHTTLGSLTNVRLDSFVYTVEGFRDAAARLSDDGLLAVTFAMLSPEQGRKLFLMLHQALGRPPRCFEVSYDGGVMMLAGPHLDRLPTVLAGLKEVTNRFADPRLMAEVSTDDWPFFYMPRRTYPLTYAIMVVVLLAISVSLIAWQLGAPKLTWPRAVPSPHRGEGQREGRSVAGTGPSIFFFLGAGFMLIETKSITQLGLVLGNTWQVLAAVISSILLLAFAANVWVSWRGPLARVPGFALVACSILLQWPLSRLTAAGWPAGLVSILATVSLTLPLLFSGLIFSSELSRGAKLSDALAANLFGAMLGGFLEYNSMYWGYASLNWMALALYGVGWLCAMKPLAASICKLRLIYLVPKLQRLSGNS
jgi:hypothetical protein